ncbi:MAG: DUF4845 domain-containing protein [Xanthomonadaceae bacterium]|nr:DUF4845 domain-containing protein [Xanthomonadaceae bacterium]
MSSNQRGMTLIGFLILLTAAVFVVYIGMKLVPIYLNHYSVISSLKGIADEPDVANMSEARIRDLLSRRFQTNYVTHIRARDIEIVRGRPLQIIAEYEVREGLVANIDAVVSFRRVQAIE